MSGFKPPGECPVCGAEVPAGAKACPDCGACEQTGWNEDAEYSHLDLPDPDGEGSSRPYQEEEKRPKGRAFLPLLILVVLAMILSGAYMLLQRR